MEKNNSDKYDYALPVELGKGPGCSASRTAHEPGQYLKDAMFMQYASSIIQVVSEEKLQKSHQLAMGADYQPPIFEISEVNTYGPDSKMRNLDLQLAQSNNYNPVGPSFKKKREHKKLLAYSYTNFTTLTLTLSRLLAKTVKAALESLQSSKASQKRDKKQASPQKKERGSVNSRSTSYTSIDDFRSRKHFQTQKRIQLIEQMREGANTIKGWVEFKVLMLQSAVLRDLLLFSRDRPSKQELSPIACSKKEYNFSEKFCLTEYQQENSMNIEPHLHFEEESLAYTVDQNFQLSGKECTMTTPEKLSQDGRPHLEAKEKGVNNPILPDARQSIVSPYKAYLKTSKVIAKSNVLEQSSVSIAKPIELSSKQRRYLSIRTNIFELPLISENDLRFTDKIPSSDQPLTKDQMGSSQPEMGCEQVESTLRDLDATSALFESKSSKGFSGSEKSSAHSYFSSNREKLEQFQKYSKGGVEASRQSDHTSTVKAQHHSITPMGDPNTVSGLAVTQERKAPLKIENYYFPGRELRSTHKGSDKSNGQAIEEIPKNRLDEVKQVDSILSSYKKEVPRAQPLRIEESMVSKFLVSEEPKVRAVRGTAFPIKADKPERQAQSPQYSHFQEKRSIEPRPQEVSKLSPRPNISAYPNRADHYSPNHMHHLGTLKKQEPQPLRSPPNRGARPLSPAPNHYQIFKSGQQELSSINSVRKMEPVIRSDSKNPMPKVNFNHNIYQINQNINQKRPIPANSPAYRNQPRPYQPTQPRTQVAQPIQTNPPSMQPLMRPPSRIFSPQHCLPQEQAYARPVSRENSQKKASFFSPQPQQYGMQSPHISPKHQPYPCQKEYFLPEQLQVQSAKSVDFNNGYYCMGGPERQNPLMGRQGLDEGKRGPGADRPHSSSRQSVDRTNMFSNISPGESQLVQSQGRSNHLSSRNSSKILRPRSMDQKLHITMRRER